MGRVTTTEELYDTLKHLIGGLPATNVRRLTIDLRAGDGLPTITAELYATNGDGKIVDDATHTHRFITLTKEEYDDLVFAKKDVP